MNKNNVIHCIGFIAVFLVAFLILETAFFDQSKIDYQWSVFSQKDVEADIVVLGNSHAYTSTDANVLTDILGMNVEVFASPSSNMQQTLIHFKQAIEYAQPQYVFLEAYTASISNREELMDEQRGMLVRDLDGIQSLVDKANAVATMLHWYHFPEGMFQLLRPIHMWDRWNMENNGFVYSETHGYNARNTFAGGSRSIQDMENLYKESKESQKITEYCENDLRELLEIAKDRGIFVVLYKAPAISGVKTERVNEVFRIASEYSNVVFMENYCDDMTDIGLNIDDFYDGGHLNRRGGAKFTIYFAKQLESRLGLECNWSNARGYKGESVIELGENKYRYEMEVFGDDMVFQYSLYKGKERIDRQAYSVCPYYDTSIDVLHSDEYHLYCSIIPSDRIEEGDACTQRVYTAFMKQNDCVID